MKTLAALVLLAEEGEEKFEAHHWWWPETKEIIWGGLAFLIIAFLLWKFAGPPIKKAMQARTQRIGDELDRAAAERSTAEEEATRLKASVRDADADGARMLTEADEAAARMLEQGRAQLEIDVADLEARAAADLETGAGRTAAELQTTVGKLAATAADRIVARSLDEGYQQQLVDDYIATVGSAR